MLIAQGMATLKATSLEDQGNRCKANDDTYKFGHRNVLSATSMSGHGCVVDGSTVVLRQLFEYYECCLHKEWLPRSFGGPWETYVGDCENWNHQQS